MNNFERIVYPDGQIGAKIKTDGISSDHVIRERINSYEDLFYIRSIADIIENKGLKAYSLFIPCMFGQRSDRRFTTTQSFDLKLITDVINNCSFDNVTVFDPHSDVTMALIKRSEKKSSFEFVQKATNNMVEREGDQIDILLVSPDAGAYKKVFEYGEKLGYPVMGAMKHRDNTGKISLMFTHNVEDKDCLIVDDLCDGGYTFELLGKALKDHGARKVYLYVSHGLFSKGFDKLREVIDGIYCTNSVKDIVLFKEGKKPEIKIDGILIPSFGAQEIDTFFTQYKII